MGNGHREAKQVFQGHTASQLVAKLGFESIHLASESTVIITFLHGLFQRNEGWSMIPMIRGLKTERGRWEINVKRWIKYQVAISYVSILVHCPSSLGRSGCLSLQEPLILFYICSWFLLCCSRDNLSWWAPLYPPSPIPLGTYPASFITTT